MLLLGYLGEGRGNPLQYSCLENPMDEGAWQATVHGVQKSRVQLSNDQAIFLQTNAKSYPLSFSILF